MVLVTHCAAKLNRVGFDFIVLDVVFLDPGPTFQRNIRSGDAQELLPGLYSMFNGFPRTLCFHDPLVHALKGWTDQKTTKERRAGGDRLRPYPVMLSFHRVDLAK